VVKNQEQKRIYIAYPYQSDYSDKNSQQHNSLSQLAAALTQEGHSVFCPMFQAHSLYQYGTKSNDTAWNDIIQTMIGNWATDFYLPYSNELCEAEEINSQLSYASQSNITVTWLLHEHIDAIIADANLSAKIDNGTSSILSKYNSAVNFCSNSDRGRGVWIRIHENRELLQVLQKHASHLLDNFPYIEWWLAQQDIFLVVLAQILQLEIDPRFKNHHFPRPWTGSFALDKHYQEFLELYTVK